MYPYVSRLRVVPHFSSGIVEGAKRERAWKSSPRPVPPFLTWGDFHARSRFASSTIPEEKWGTTQPRPQGFSLKKWVGPHPFFEGKALGTRLWTTRSSLVCIPCVTRMPVWCQDLKRNTKGGISRGAEQDEMSAPSAWRLPVIWRFSYKGSRIRALYLCQTLNT